MPQEDVFADQLEEMVQELTGTFAVVFLRGIFGSVGSVIERQQKMHQQGCNHFVAGNEVKLLNGGTGKVILPTSLHNAIVIPQEATYDIQDKVYVVKVVEGKAVASMIQVESATDGKSYVVIDGLKAGEVIIAKGAGFVREGTKINSAN